MQTVELYELSVFYCYADCIKEFCVLRARKFMGGCLFGLLMDVSCMDTCINIQRLEKTES